MINIYYMIWVDAIQSIRKHHPHKKTWKKEIFILITWMHSMDASHNRIGFVPLDVGKNPVGADL